MTSQGNYFGRGTNFGRAHRVGISPKVEEIDRPGPYDPLMFIKPSPTYITIPVAYYKMV